MTLTLNKLSGPAACNQDDGWFVLTATGQTAVLCPKSCTTLQNDSNLSVALNVTCP